MCGRVLGAALLLVGCIIRSPEPVAEKKGIGQLLDDALGGAAKVADEVKKVDVLVQKSAKTALSQEEVADLAEAIVKGGGKTIEAFKEASLEEVINVVVRYDGLVKGMFNRFGAAFQSMPVKQQEALAAITDPKKNASEAVAIIKKHTNLASDKIFARQIELLGESLDEMAGAIADNHRLAEAVGAELRMEFKSNSRLLASGIEADDVAAELKIGMKDVFVPPELLRKSSENTFIIQEITGVDIWRETVHLELMLRRGDDGKPLYTKLTPEQIGKLGNPFDKKFTEPFLQLKNEVFFDGYIVNLYKKGKKVYSEEGDDQFVRELAEELGVM